MSVINKTKNSEQIKDTSLILFLNKKIKTNTWITNYMYMKSYNTVHVQLNTIIYQDKNLQLHVSEKIGKKKSISKSLNSKYVVMNH